jgi:hypothetical protein
VAASSVSVCSGADVSLSASGSPSEQYIWYAEDSTRLPNGGATLILENVQDDTYYFVASTDGKSCVSDLNRIDVTTILVAKPTLTIIEDTLHASINPAYTNYQWILNGIDLDEEHADILVPADSGWYAVTAFRDACYSTSDSVFFRPAIDAPEVPGDSTTVAITPDVTEFQVESYPSPSDGTSIYLRIHSPAGKPVNIVMMNASGQILYDHIHSIDSRQQEFQLINGKAIPSGLYFVKVTQGTRIKTSKIIIRE